MVRHRTSVRRWRGSSCGAFAWVGLCLLPFLALVVHADQPGEGLYRQGLLSTGEPLQGVRSANAPIQGADAACVNCHRRSGLGTTEGQITIPPITGPYLYRPGNQRIDDEAVPFVGAARVKHTAYTDETLARAIREGTGADGQPLSYLMPRYSISDADMSALIAYLKSMAPARTPGVTDSELHFATIITPDADPVSRQGMLDVLEKYFLDKNAAARAVAPRLYVSRPMMFRVSRKWALHVWTLTGAPDTWEAQLRAHLAAEPVFAVISGLGRANWEPVSRFCEAQSLPCLFPNIDVPAARADDFYSVYFSRGVLLEAQLIAGQARDFTGGHPLSRVVQVFRTGDAGETAAAALRASMRGTSIEVQDRALRADGKDLSKVLKKAGRGDALVLWLRPEDLRNLPQLPADTPVVWMSGLLGGLENAPLPAGWRGVTQMAYPFDLPQRRQVRVDYAFGWFGIRHVPVVAPRVQADTYLACGLLSEILSHMVETFERDYLIERVEMGVDHRVLTGYYPRLSLSSGQQFASKGGYITRFTDAQGTGLTAMTDWLTP